MFSFLFLGVCLIAGIGNLLVGRHPCRRNARCDCIQIAGSILKGMDQEGLGNFGPKAGVSRSRRCCIAGAFFR